MDKKLKNSQRFLRPLYLISEMFEMWKTNTALLVLLMHAVLFSASSSVLEIRTGSGP